MSDRQLDHVFGLYKPFRNQLRNLELFDSLYVIWSFARNLTFDLPFPEDIQLPRKFQPGSPVNTRRYQGINDFELEFLYKELLLNAPPEMLNKHSLKTVDTLAKVINYVRHELSDRIDQKYLDSKDVIINFNRLFHQQFKWQRGYTRNSIFRYYKVFSAPEVDALVQKAYGLTTWELFILGFFFFRLSGDQFKMSFPFFSKMTRLTDEMIANFFKIFSVTLPEIQDQIKATHEMNENLLYGYDPVATRPILVHGNFCICPVPMLLFWQVTSGTYYAIVQEKNFNHAFGQAFEQYIGEVISKVNDGRFIIHPEIVYGKQEKRSVDWLIEEAGALLFVECKAKRMTVNAKTKAGITEALIADLNKMSDFVLQLYKSLIEYLEGKYPHRPYDPDLSIHLMVLTFEPWYLEYNLELYEMVKDRLIALFHQNGLDTDLIEKYPYYISSSEEFESDLQVMHEIGIGEYYEQRRKNELHEIVQKFKYRNLFRDQFRETFLDPLTS